MGSGERQPPMLMDARRERESLARERAARGGPILERAARIIDDAARDWRRAPDVIARALREARELSSTDRRLLGEMVHGWVRWRRRLAALAGAEDVRGELRAWLEAGEGWHVLPPPVGPLGVA